MLLQQTWLKQIFETTKDKCKISPSKSYLLMSTSMDTSEVLDKKSIFIIHYKSNNLTDSATKINVQVKNNYDYLQILVKLESFYS